MGVEPRHTGEMKAFVKVAVEAKVDAVQIYSLDIGHGVQPAAQELEAYFREVLDSCPLPAVLSSHGFVGYLVPIDTIERLAGDYRNLIGVNISTPDTLYLSEAISRLTPRLEIHVGGPMHTVTALALGGNGYLSTESNISPRLCQEAIDHFRAGRMTRRVRKLRRDHGADARGQFDGDGFRAPGQGRDADCRDGRHGPAQTICAAARRGADRVAARIGRRRAPV